MMATPPPCESMAMRAQREGLRELADFPGGVDVEVGLLDQALLELGLEPVPGGGPAVDDAAVVRPALQDDDGEVVALGLAGSTAMTYDRPGSPRRAAWNRTSPQLGCSMSGALGRPTTHFSIRLTA
jgi:hypothetical protein